MIRSRSTPSFVRRCVSFAERIRWISSLAGGYISAFKILISIRRNQDAVQSIFYRGNPVRFRGPDEQALQEVLVDHEYEFLSDMLSAASAPTILDIGAHIGTFAIWVFGVNEKARIWSVEADPDTYNVARSNARAFVESGAEWRVIHAAAARVDGEVLRLSDAGPSMSHHIGPDGTVEVYGISLATLLNEIASNGATVDLVKIDIEGSEEAFLCAYPDALERVGSLVIELHPNLCDTDRVQSLLEEYFDHIEDIGGRKSTKPLLYCRRNVNRETHKE